MNKSTLKTAGVILAVYGICAFVQLRVMRVPIIGAYLPGGSSGVAVATSV
jgi:hypothetical protein